MQTYVLSDVLVAVASLDLKAPDRRRERDCLNYPSKVGRGEDFRVRDHKLVVRIRQASVAVIIT